MIRGTTFVEVCFGFTCALAIDPPGKILPKLVATTRSRGSAYVFWTERRFSTCFPATFRAS